MRVSIKAAIDGYPPLSDTPMLLDVWQLFSCCQWCRSALPKEGATTTNNHKGINILGIYKTYYGTIPFIPQDEEVEGCSTLADLEIVLKVIKAHDMFWHHSNPVLTISFDHTIYFKYQVLQCTLCALAFHKILMIHVFRSQPELPNDKPLLHATTNYCKILHRWTYTVCFYCPIWLWWYYILNWLYESNLYTKWSSLSQITVHLQTITQLEHIGTT